MLFWLASYPRSGSNFFVAALTSLTGVPLTFVENCEPLMRHLMGDASVEALHEERRRIAETAARVKKAGTAPAEAPVYPEGPAWSQRPVEEQLADPQAYMLKTHCPPTENELPAIYIVRDGRDVLVSYANFSPIFDPAYRKPPELFRKHLEMRMRDGVPRYGTWSENVEPWLDRPNTHVVHFADMIADPIAAVEQAIEALRLPLEIKGRNVPTFDELRSKAPLHYRRGKVGSWRDEFPADLLPEFWERHGHVMQRLGFQEEQRASA